VVGCVKGEENMIKPERLEFAAKQVVDVCLNAKKGEKAMIISDLETKHIAQAIEKRLKEVTGAVKMFIMEDFGPRSSDGVNPLKFPDEIKNTMLSSDISVYAAQGKKGELDSFRKPLLATTRQNPKLKHAHMINVTDEIMESGMCTDYKVVKEVTAKVGNIVKNASAIRVTTKLGTDIVAEFSKDIRWCPFDGNIAPGRWSNLPDGEIFTAPKDINGKLVVDGVLGDYLCKFGLLDKNPIEIVVKNGKAVEVNCSNKELLDELKSYLHKGENSDRVGEFAIGTNIGLDKLIGNLLQDEKFPGIHIAFGDPYSHETGANWSADTHVDMVIQKVNVEADGKQIIRDGKFLI